MHQVNLRDKTTRQVYKLAQTSKKLEFTTFGRGARSNETYSGDDDHLRKKQVEHDISEGIKAMISMLENAIRKMLKEAIVGDVLSAPLLVAAIMLLAVTFSQSRFAGSPQQDNVPQNSGLIAIPYSLLGQHSPTE
eukprot:CAMPEP_0180792890 /NCGR_PEP_ID=MMETSP1038_2-20121128/54681_1 /TAXON_ID=632150 /ORGANISM="Azadinium spinosum, Strain 3D9" /LENGTH=134 /DNA_ID=CAMNT_0022831321 /DNA_START=192 /DNA_END=597 /DNA_ORIENTATION=+